MRASIEADGPWRTFGAPFELYQDSSGGDQWASRNHVNREGRVPATFRGYRVVTGGCTETGLRSTPVVSATAGDTTVELAAPLFWQNCPKAIEIRDRALTLRLFPGQYGDLYELQGGEQKTHECFIDVGPARNADPVLEWCRDRWIVAVAPDDVIESDAVTCLAAMDPDQDRFLQQIVDGPSSFAARREIIDEYGWRHFGELYGDHEGVRHKGPTPLVSHYNNQYDPVLGFAYQFLRTGDPRWWTLMTELAAHVIDIDVYRTTSDKAAYNYGLFWHTYHYGDAETATHRTYPRTGQGKTHGGGPSADHNYPAGLALYYFLTGDAQARETALALAQFVIDMDDGRRSVFRWLDRGDTGLAAQSDPGYYGPGRGPANSLRALVVGHRLSGDSRFLAKAEALVRRVVHPREPIERWRLDDPEAHWYYTMFLQSLGVYLIHKETLERLDADYVYARETLLHYAEWMAAHEYPYLERPEKLEFPTETWAAQEIRKSDVFHFAARYADNERRSRFLERGRFFHQYAVTTVPAMPTGTLLRPLVILLTSGHVGAWAEARSRAVPSASATGANFGEIAVFVPQRVRAKRRAIWIMALGTLAAALALAYWFVR